ARLNASRISVPIDALGPDNVLMNPTFTLSAACAVNAAAIAAANTMLRMLPPLPWFALDAHLFVDDSAALDHHFAVERDGAVAHRHVVVPARIPLAAALGVRAGGEQEIAGKGARRGAMPLGRVAMQRDPVPQRLRIHPPAEMRYRIRIAIGRRRSSVVQPVAHQLCVHGALDLDDVTFADGELHRVGDVAAVRQDDDVAGLE